MATEKLYIDIEARNNAINEFKATQKAINDNIKALKGLELQGKQNTKEFQLLKQTTQQLQSSLSSATKGLGSVGQSTKLLTMDNLKLIAGYAGLTLGIQQFVSFLKDSVESFAQQEQAVVRLNFALDENAVVTKRLTDRASELESKTIYSDESIAQAQSFLAIQGRNEEQINKVISAAIDLSAVTGDDLQTSVQKLDMTYEGQIGRLGKLEGSLKGLTKEQLENGDAIDIIAKKYQGLGQEIGTTTYGKIEQAKNQWDNFKEAVGEFVILGDPLMQVARDMGGSIEEIGNAANFTARSIRSMRNDVLNAVEILQQKFNVQQLTTGIGLPPGAYNVPLPPDYGKKKMGSGKTSVTKEESKEEAKQWSIEIAQIVSQTLLDNTMNILGSMKSSILPFSTEPSGMDVTASEDKWAQFWDEYYNAINESEDMSGMVMDAFGQSLGIAQQIYGLFGQGASEIISAFQTAFSIANSIISLIGTILSIASGGIPIPGFASGGTYSANMPRIVGEHGAELDIPNHSGTIIPNHQLQNFMGSQRIELEAKEVKVKGTTLSILMGRVEGMKNNYSSKAYAS